MSRRGRVLSIGAALVALAATARHADAILCRAKNDAVFVRDACKRKEVPVDLPKGDPGPKGASSLRARVVDAADKTIGHLTAFGEIVMRQGDVVLHARATVDGFVQASAVYFDAADCAGTPLVQATVTLYQRLEVIGASGYYTSDPIARHAVLSALTKRLAANCMGAGQTYDAASGLCCTNLGTPWMTPAGRAIPLDIGGFAPPFRVEIER